MSRLRATRTVLLTRQGLVFAKPTGDPVPEKLLCALDLELAELGFVTSARLRDRLARQSLPELKGMKDWLLSILAAGLGADQEHTPLYRRFPKGVPKDTDAHWVERVLCHFLQAEDQPCLFCRRTGTTHVLSPCNHVVCDHCFDGSNFSACPVCQHHLDPASPFLLPTDAQRLRLPDERVRFKLLDLGESIDDAARGLFTSFCDREQTMPAQDKVDFGDIISDYREEALSWLPEVVPNKENVAIVFGTLFKLCGPDAVLPEARRFLRTATDVLRVIAAYSGADPSLQVQTVMKDMTPVKSPGPPDTLLRRALKLIAGAPPAPMPPRPRVLVWCRFRRFEVAPLRRPLRRALLGILEELDRDLLAEDLLRHRSYWVWVGQFLHPGEYQKRFPNVARAFAIARKKGPDGSPAPPFQTYYSRLEEAAAGKNASGMADVLAERPGELARHFDHALRVAGNDAHATERLLALFTESIGEFSTPVLLTLRNFLPTRTAKAPIRIFWPKGAMSKGVSSPDTRPPLSTEAVRPAVAAVEAELLNRFAKLPPFGDVIIDEALQDVCVPFNERTASTAAVQLPRGSRIPVPSGKTARLFLHWCQPDQEDSRTDLDLSVGLYNASWDYVGVCSYYKLQHVDDLGRVVAISAGDLQDAPHPQGATEFVDLHRDEALDNGIRYAVMVVNSYAGLPFSQLERGFAGLMFRDDVEGVHFDPRTVELKFELQGGNGIFLPLALDIVRNELHWLDTYSRGEIELNNVETSNADITKICPEMISYFRSGVRMSMFELALLHAAARAERVHIRTEGQRTFRHDRRDGEDPATLLKRLREDRGTEVMPQIFEPDSPPVLAALYRGDLGLPPDSQCYALFREKLTNTIAASDLITT